MPIGPSTLSAECTQVRKICCALSAECTPELGVMSAVQSAVVHCVWSCCGHRDCARVLVVGRDGCVNEQLLRVAETHVQELHGQNALERDDE